MFYGYDQGVVSQVNLNPDYQTRMGINPVTGITYMYKLIQAARLTSQQVTQGTLPPKVVLFLGIRYARTLIGALVADSLADRCGRTEAVVFGSLWALLGALLQASAYTIAWMTCARVIAGIGGAIDCVIPVWSADVSSHSARGAFLAIEFLMILFFFSIQWS